MGITGQTAPDLNVSQWIDESGAPREPLSLSELGEGYKLIYCFQAWCPGCHSRGFPTVQKLVKNLGDSNIGFAIIQTVFEGADQNTPDKLIDMQNKYDLRLPFGHDYREGHIPTIMEDYRTGGTPWFILIGPNGTVIYEDFSLNPDALIDALQNSDGH